MRLPVPDPTATPPTTIFERVDMMPPQFSASLASDVPSQLSIHAEQPSQASASHMFVLIVSLVIIICILTVSFVLRSKIRRVLCIRIKSAHDDPESMYDSATPMRKMRLGSYLFVYLSQEIDPSKPIMLCRGQKIKYQSIEDAGPSAASDNTSCDANSTNNLANKSTKSVTKSGANTKTGAKYEQGMEDNESTGSTDERPYNSSCPICIEEYSVGETVVLLSCKHAFHVECLRKCLVHTSACPYCKVTNAVDVRETTPTPSEANERTPLLWTTVDVTRTAQSA